ncbi:Hypothetical protein KVN_LOCUS312 [uncultured virus]|nr:Hypothetical protein KVN_LOCUS312 [uncultured virus]
MEKIVKILSNLPNTKNNQIVKIFIGNFNKMIGTYLQNDEIFNQIKTKLDNNKQIFSLINRKIYCYNNMQLIIENSNQKVITSNQKYFYMDNNCLIEIIQEDNIEADKFPIIDKYFNIIEEKILNYVINNITFSLIIENEINKYLQISFKKDDKFLKNNYFETIFFILTEFF